MPSPAGTAPQHCLVCLARALTGPAAGAPELPHLEGVQVKRRLGEGGFGTVYLAKDLEEQELVAVKMLRPELAGDAAFRDRFRREFELICRFQHKGIVPVYRHRDEVSLPWFSMKLLDGPPLGPLLARRGPVRELLRLLLEVADALVYAHERGVCHLDLKPSNILLDEDGNPVIVDFGLALGAREKLPLIRRVTAGYTPGFTAPEFRGVFDPAASRPRADVYSFGAVLYMGLTGRPPPEDAAAGSLRFLPRASKDLEAICRKCLAADPNDRYARMDLVRDDLRNYLDGRPVAARPLWAGGRLWYAAGRNQVLSAALLAAALCLVLMSYFAWRQVESQRAAEQQRRQRAAEERARFAAEQVAGVADQADAAFRRGRWDKAAELYEQAIAAGHPDRPRLEGNRGRCWLATNQLDRLLLRLARLDTDPDMSDRRAELLLLRAEVVLLDPARTAEGQALVRQAVSDPRALSPADFAYAGGLLADSAADMVARFRDACTLEPTHYRGRAALAASLLVTGRLAEARTQTRFMHELFPDDPFPLLLEGLGDLLSGNNAAGRAEISRVADALGPLRGPRLRDYGDKLAAALDAARRANALPGRFDFGTLVTLAGARDILPNPTLCPVGLPAPVIRLLNEPGRAYILAATRWLAAGDLDGALAEAETALRRYPDGALAALAASILWIKSGRHYFHKPTDWAQMRAELKRVLEHAETAIRIPTRFPAPFAYQARVYAAAAAAVLMRKEVSPDPDQDHRSRLRQHLRKLVEEGEAWPELRREAVRIFLSSAILDTDQSRVLLGDWGLTARGDPEPWERLAALELKAENRAAARAAAAEAVVASPDDLQLKARLDRLLQQAPGK
jgi:tetratricopeptide (TPR) repeat protein